MKQQRPRRRSYRRTAVRQLVDEFQTLVRQRRATPTATGSPVAYTLGLHIIH